MFGKRKGGVSSSKGKVGSEADTSVIIPQIRTNDNNKILPKITSALCRPRDEQIPAEDLDAVQLELETLLSSVALRYRVLKSEYDSILSDDKSIKKGKHLEKTPSSPGKRKKNNNDGEPSGRKPKIPQFKLAKQKLPTSASSPAQSQNTDDSQDSFPYMLAQQPKDQNKLLLPKNDVPNKFWLSVEPYCMPLTNEDLRLLDDLMDQYQGQLVPPIPELGPHYTTAWTAEDIKEEQDNSSSAGRNKKNALGLDTDLFKRSEKIMGVGISGPLTQRLVSALIEENIPMDGISNGDSNSCSSENTNTINSNSFKTLQNGIVMEKRVKKELIEQGILEDEPIKVRNCLIYILVLKIIVIICSQKMMRFFQR
ncbi:TADA3 family protein [Megaselia abdita]